MQKRGDRNPQSRRLMEARNYGTEYVRGGSYTGGGFQKSAHGIQIPNLCNCGVTPRKAGQGQLSKKKNNNRRAAIQLAELRESLG